MARKKYGPVTQHSDAYRNMHEIMEEDKKKQVSYGHSRAAEPQGKRGSVYEIEVFKAQWHPVAEAKARGATELRSEKRRLTSGMKRGSYRVKVYNKTTGKEISRGKK